MDVAYVRGWSLGLDLRLLFRHPVRTPSAASGDRVSQPVRVAVVGLGYWGPNLVRNLAELDVAELVAVCDLDPERLALIGRRYPAVRRTTDVEARDLCGRRRCSR